jgi:hypothetical protein
MAGDERFETVYLVLSGTTTAARGPEILRGLVGLGFATVIALPTPNAARTISGRELADVAGAQVVESYFDLAIRPRPPRGVVLFAPCSFNSLNKLAHGIADNLAMSVVAEAIGRNTPVIVGPSLNQPLLDHPQAQASLRLLPTWGVTIVPPVDTGEGPRLAPTEQLLAAVRPYIQIGRSRQAQAPSRSPGGRKPGPTPQMTERLTGGPRLSPGLRSLSPEAGNGQFSTPIFFRSISSKSIWAPRPGPVGAWT